MDKEIHSAFLKFIEICAEIKYGTIERLQIQDGIPVIIETKLGTIVLPEATITKKTKLV